MDAYLTPYPCLKEASEILPRATKEKKGSLSDPLQQRCVGVGLEITIRGALCTSGEAVWTAEPQVMDQRAKVLEGSLISSVGKEVVATGKMDEAGTDPNGRSLCLAWILGRSGTI